ncbi:hypothetical protein A2642_04115 [Candidatus Nomurabacteria bacterium RIFCSPHIGHO2_01_FULL_39_10]|uniref:Uncharacterized protein n=1 Tax=Candidatus Nomurabacteria bacterium RIFCSPHIGHO2_01_FULL_39_10 TaxID=1801733 RepID=A0A1F6V869_9BACT|nr:MAG: hypothetical protein A2642_04115 [Candidatus Nomurabacteria bacterium RIFCSPHIGHO2_01_FULL_39_10]
MPRTLDTVIDNSTKNPFDANYQHGTIHPQYSSPKNTSIIPLFPEEETYFRQKGFAVIYTDDIPNIDTLPQKSVTYPFILMSQKSDYLAKGNLQIILSEMGRTLHAGHCHPSVIALDRLVNTIEHDILSKAKYFNNKDNPITILLEDEPWLPVISLLHEKYGNLKTYRTVTD